MDTTVRPMTEADVDAAREVQNASFADYDRRFDEEPVQLTPEVVERQRRRLDHFLAHDPDGCWVAEQDGTLVGVALASQRDALWGLSLLVVSPGAQSRGVGRRLLDAALAYARAGEPAVILSSRDPRAMHGYATAGFDLHPQVEARGEVVTRWLQKPDRDLREGRLDRSFADRLDAAVRGSRRGADHEVLGTFYDAFAIDDASGAGYAYLRPAGHVETVAATDDDTAAALLWQCLARAHEREVRAVIPHVNAANQWAIRVAVAARLPLAPMGPVFWRGRTPPASYLPTGAYL